MNKQTKLYAQLYGWHLERIASFTYIKRTQDRWVRRRRATDSHNFTVGGLSGGTVHTMVTEGLVQIDGSILSVTVKGRHVVRVMRKQENAKRRRLYLESKRA